MSALNVIAVMLALLVALDNIHESNAGWFRVRVRIPVVIVGKRSTDFLCQDVYGIACKAAKVEIETRNNIDVSGTGCQVDSSKACGNQKREFSPNTADGLKYVPLPSKFENYDTNDDKKITFEEFSGQILPRYPIHNTASLKTMFAAADLDADGVLNRSEFSEAPFVQVTLNTRGEDNPKENERNAIEDDSMYEQSQKSENET